MDHKHGTIVKIEFLCDLDYEPAESLVMFSGAKTLGVVNLRGTGYASRDWIHRNLSAIVDDRLVAAQVRFGALAGYLLAKAHAAPQPPLRKGYV